MRWLFACPRDATPMVRYGRTRYGRPVKGNTTLAATALALCSLSALPARSAHGHVAPSRDTNNRYIKLTPMRDRVRLAYTVFLGELPGAQARRQMDANRDGRIDEQEAQHHAVPLAESVQQNLVLTVDGSAHALSWSELHVGLGTPVTDAGAVSIDLIGWLCLGNDTGAAAGREHAVTLHDRFRLPRPGETELHVQASPGISVTRSAVGPESRDVVRLAFQWHGSQVPLASEGYQLAFTVAPDAALLPAGGPCDAPRARAPGWRPGLVLLLAVLLLGAAGAGWRWRQAWKPLRRRTDR